jgi:hypothetical protein
VTHNFAPCLISAGIMIWYFNSSYWYHVTHGYDDHFYFGRYPFHKNPIFLNLDSGRVTYNFLKRKFFCRSRIGLIGYPIIHPVKPVTQTDQSESGQISDGSPDIRIDRISEHTSKHNCSTLMTLLLWRDGLCFSFRTEDVFYYCYNLLLSRVFYRSAI